MTATIIQSHDASASPSAEAQRQAEAWLLYDATGEFGALVASLGTSIAEASYRGHGQLIYMHVRELRAVVVELIPLAKRLGGIAL
ncbi:MAG: hypothetical protein KGQ46_10615 [Hyphomicrobiales bacterium]|nr:hypothetical protein [Hyphomicrobiales bacterium]MDE2116052.1 hypothetical protein [Hyphomicrobiales bacterium]